MIYAKSEEVSKFLCNLSESFCHFIPVDFIKSTRECANCVRECRFKFVIDLDLNAFDLRFEKSHLTGNIVVHGLSHLFRCTG